MAAGGNGDGSEKRQPDKIEITPGCQVWCKTRFEEIQGTVTAYDHENKVIFIKSSSSEKRTKPNIFDVSIVNLNHLSKTNFKVLSLPKENLPRLYDIDYGKINRRLMEANSEKVQKAEKIGINVSSEAQALFDSISKLFPECKWEGDNIVVMEEVRISPPYKPENCFGQKRDSLERLQKLVKKFHSEWQKDSKH
ncbi:protein LSM12-like [Rhopilema esculentum]|uniref:protein LSM12-like n=1 Tax=Rhopilema esculentum TaxID=499914 RepID=UPI0031D14110